MEQKSNKINPNLERFKYEVAQENGLSLRQKKENGKGNPKKEK